MYDELLLDWLDSDLLRALAIGTIFCSALVCLLQFSFGLHVFLLPTGDLGGDDLLEALSGEGLDDGECGSWFLDGCDAGCDAESGETGRDLVTGDPGADLTELARLWGDLGPSLADGGGEEYGSGLSESTSLGDFGASGDFGPAGDAGIEFSGELMSECAPLRLPGDWGLGDEGCIEGDGDLLSGDGDRGPSDLGERGDLGGDFGPFFETSLLSEEELRRLLELELLLLEDDCASPLPSRESSESIPENRFTFWRQLTSNKIIPNPEAFINLLYYIWLFQ